MKIKTKKLLLGISLFVFLIAVTSCGEGQRGTWDVPKKETKTIESDSLQN